MTGVTVGEFCPGLENQWGTSTIREVFTDRVDDYLMQCTRDYKGDLGWHPVMTLDEFVALARGEDVTIARLPFYCPPRGCGELP